MYQSDQPLPSAPIATGDRRLIDLCAAADVADGQVIRAEVAGHGYAVYRVEGEFYVTDDSCTHGPGSLSEGYLDGFEIECDFHQGCFDIRTGAVTAPPCMVPIGTYTVVVEAGRVQIEAPAEAG